MTESREPPVPPIRILTAVPICDGHDSAINTINLEFIRHGVEVVYLGYNRSAKDIARAALQEDVVAIGISTYNGNGERIEKLLSDADEHLYTEKSQRKATSAAANAAANASLNIRRRAQKA